MVGRQPQVGNTESGCKRTKGADQNEDWWVSACLTQWIQVSM